MKRIFLALAISLAMVACAIGATTTTPVTLSSSAYTDLGAGPMWLGSSNGDLSYQISDAQPSASAAGDIQRQGVAPVRLDTTSHVWAIAPSAAVKAIVSAGTGLAGGGSVSVNNAPVGAATIATGQYSNATASATSVVGARTGASGTGRISVTFYNTGSVSVFVGPSGVTTATGIPILPGGSFTLYTTAAVFGVPASGTGTLAYLETY